MNGANGTRKGVVGTRTSIDAPALSAMVLAAFERLQEQSDLLSELDRAIGDGDHGTTMSRAAGRIRVRLLADDAPHTIAAVLDVVGSTFLNLDGGATGPLFGTFFSGMAKAAGDRDHIDSDALPTMFSAGLKAVQGLTSAVPGDKTLVDALVPAVSAVETSSQLGEPPLAQLDSAAAAAEAGAASTSDLRARHGRARHLGDRAIGHEDPGARSMAILLRGLAAEGARVVSMED